jgi:hypothetical protein
MASRGDRLSSLGDATTKGILNGPMLFGPKAGLDRLHRAADMKRDMSSPFAVCIGTAPSGPMHLVNWPYGLNLDSFFTKMKLNIVQINIVQINTPQINISITIIMGNVNIHTTKFKLTT